MPKLIYRPDFRDKAKLAKQQRPVARKNKDGSKSTHLYEYGQFDNKFVVYPTIFPKSAKSTSNPKDWIELDSDKAYDEARRRGEVIEFNDEHSAKGFSAGAWKDVVDDSSTGSVVNSPLKKKYQSGRGNISKYHLQSLFSNGGKIATKTNPSLWEKAKAQAKARMGGKHSARAMQLAVSIYKKAGGGYKGPKKETGLSKWTKQDWTTSSGKPSEGKRRYLPRKAWSALSSAEKAATNRAKAEGNKQGKQFVAQPKTIAKKVVKYRR